MSELVLTVGKLVLLLALYLFLGRAVRTVVLDVAGSRQRPSAPRRPRTASPDRSTGGSTPKEIVVHAPDADPQVIALNGHNLTLGRASRVSVPVDDRFVSDEHAELSHGGQGWALRDLGSTNGTFLNGAKVTRPTPVGPGDQIRLGKTHVEVRR